MPSCTAIFTSDKCIIRTNGKICQTTDELLASKLFAKVVKKYVWHLHDHSSVLLEVFGDEEINKETIDCLVKTFQSLGESSVKQTAIRFSETMIFLENQERLNDFVEGLYNYWRSFNRFLICHSEIEKEEGKSLEAKPYRVFNKTAEKLTHMVRAAYRDIQENITGRHCRVYRQVSAGTQIGLIAVKKKWPCPGGQYVKLRDIPMIRQILLNPPLIIDPSMNKRDGQFKKVYSNPLGRWAIDTDEWLCYPARVGPLLIHIFFNQIFMELGCALANLFDLAEDEDLRKKPDAIYAFGAPEGSLDGYGLLPTVFFDDTKNNILVGAIPANKEFGYFGYLKKMALTLHNVVMMKRGIMPYHGAMVHILLKNNTKATVLLIGDTGAGKSETLEALRVLGDKHIRDMIIIADDMGSIKIGSDGRLLGYGTETGAFVRLDDLQPGYVFGQIDRAIIMSPQKVNARAVLPITTLANVQKGYPIDFVFYANNYEQTDNNHPVIERFHSSDDALRVFSEGMVMSKGTTTSTGIGHSYWANPFGPPQCKDLHDQLAVKYFQAAFDNNTYVGQIRTRLGVPSWETDGPKEGAKELLKIISSKLKI